MMETRLTRSMVEVLGACPLCGHPIAAAAPNAVTPHGPGVCTPAAGTPPLLAPQKVPAPMPSPRRPPDVT
jgi:hypothetical protein